MRKNSVLFVAAVLSAATLISSCGKESNHSKVNFDLSSYPIETGDVELTYWVSQNATLSTLITNYGETEFAKEREKQTGVKVRYIHPALGQDGEAFNLMVASNDLPDMIEAMWSAAMSGGATAAIRGEVIRPLNDLLPEYAPALKKYLDEHPDIDRAAKLDDGNYFCFPSIRGDVDLFMSAGPIIRRDWLDKAGLETPKTIEDWEAMLTAFKENGATAPLTMQSTNRSRLFSLVGSGYEFYLEDNKIKYAPLSDEFKSALEILNRWFEKGLLDPNYNLVDSKLFDSNILNGLSGATIGSGGGDLGDWLSVVGDNPDFVLEGIAMPLNQQGEPNQFSPASSYFDNHGTGITTACKYPELAAKFLDYNYTDEGYILNNFGVEGTTFEYVDGVPTYTDLILNNPNGMTISQAMGNYIHASSSGPYIQDKGYLLQYYKLQPQKDAWDLWNDNAELANSYKVPNLSLTTEETSEYANLYTEIKKYCNETVVEFINGTKSLDHYDEFVNTLKQMNIERVLEIQNDALARYNKR